MTGIKSALEHGRASFDRHAWGEAFEAFVGAERESPLDRDDLERLAWSAALRGRDEAFLGALERLHDACVEAHDRRRAARAAFWISFFLSMIGRASAAGWLMRARRLVEDEQEPCAERGYNLLLTVSQHLGAGDNAQALDAASDAARIGKRCKDRDLFALAVNLQARALLRLGRFEPGLALLDEVMVTVTSGQLSPLVTGIIYCNAIVRCQELYALERAREWTAALERWCREQPQLVTFTGNCRVHRAEIMQLGGAWREALEQVRPVCDRSTEADPDAFGQAWYQRAELLRLRGDLDGADAAYRLTSDHGCEPQPGLALLRLTQGQIEAAISAIRRVLSTATAKSQRARLLPAFVEIMLSAGEIDEARAACSELEEIAGDFGTEILGAMAAHARGAIALVDGDHRGAIEPLRHAFSVWQRVGAPYLAARIRVLLGRACLELGDREGAELERAAARKVFEELGAESDLFGLDAATAGSTLPPSVQGLSKREIEVLRLLASGKTNKAIARELFVSDRTIDRHVSNIFTKIGVDTRAAATAFAYKNRLV